VVVFPALVFERAVDGGLRRRPDRSQSARQRSALSAAGLWWSVRSAPVTSLMADNDRLDTTLYQARRARPTRRGIETPRQWPRSPGGDSAHPHFVCGRGPSACQLTRLPEQPFHPGRNGYHYEVESDHGPLSRRLCDADLDPWGQRPGKHDARRLGVFLHVVLPDDLRQILPPLSQDWKNFIRASTGPALGGRRDADRRDGTTGFIAGISGVRSQADALYLHALLPHGSVHLPQEWPAVQGSGDVTGLRPPSVWVDDPWPGAAGYRHHLLQMQFVDSLVGRWWRA